MTPEENKTPLRAYVNPPKEEEDDGGRGNMSLEAEGSDLDGSDNGTRRSPITGMATFDSFGNNCRLFGYYFGFLGPFCWYSYVLLYIILLVVIIVLLRKVLKKK